MVGILIVAHSEQLANGVKEFADQATHGQVPIVAAGGAIDGSLGISAEAIRDGLRRIAGADGVLVLVDFTSAALSVEAVLEDEPAMRVVISNAPLVEGAISQRSKRRSAQRWRKPLLPRCVRVI